MRVAMVCPYSLTRPGGVQHQALGLTEALRGRGVDVRLIGPCDGPPPVPGVVSVGPSVAWETNGSVAPIAITGAVVARRTMSALRSIGPDVLHLHEPLVPGPTMTALLGATEPMVGTFHIAGEFPLQWGRPAFGPMASRLDRMYAVSEAAASLAREMYHHDCEVLWNGIDLETPAVEAVADLSEPAVLFIGRHEPRKGLSVLLEAWDGIDRDATLWVAGTGPETEELRRRKVRGVEWLGFISDADKAARLGAATVYCAPALGGESFGIVLLEAMAAGTAIVASEIDGYANVARPDQESLLVPPDDADALRSALRRMLDEPGLRERLALAGRSRATEFSMKRLAGRYEEIYGELAGG